MNNDELIKEFLENGGEIEKLPPQEYEQKYTIGSTVKKTPELKTLEEGRLLYTKKQVNKRKKKEVDLSDIDMSLIPDDLKQLVGYKDETKEDDIETN